MKRQLDGRKRTRYGILSAMLVLAGLVLFGESSADALPIFWTGAISTDWNIADNWNPNTVPGFAGEDVQNTTANAIVHGSGIHTINSFASTGTASFDLTGGTLA